MKFETIGILHIIIQIVSTKFLIPAGSMFVVLKTSQKFSELQKIRELDIIEKFARLWSLRQLEFYILSFKLSQLNFLFQLAQSLLFSKHLKSFQSFRKSKSWILLRSLLGHEVWDNWNFTYYHSYCLNYNSYSSWLNVCCSQNISKVFRALEDQRAGYY